MRALFAFLLVSTPNLFGFSISLNYVTLEDPLFSATAKATLEKAAADLSAAVTTQLNDLSETEYMGLSGGTSLSATWEITYGNPNGGAPPANITNFDFTQGKLEIYVGAQDFSGTKLGEGGPGGTSLGLSSSVSSDVEQAVSALELSSNTGMLRGGPQLGSLSFDVAGVPANLAYGYSVGVIAFDNTANWHVDYSSLPGVLENDLYSVALHEMAHAAAGFGIGDTWVDHVSGSNWTGLHVSNLLGSGVGALSSDQAHIREGLTGFPLINGVFDHNAQQEALLDPTLTRGTRKYLTDLDLAFLQDMGWEVVPEPSVVGLIILAVGCLTLLRVKSFRPAMVKINTRFSRASRDR